MHVILAAMIEDVGKFIASSDITLAAMMEAAMIKGIAKFIASSNITLAAMMEGI